MLGAVLGDLREDLREIWGEELFSLEKEDTSDFERQNTIGKTTNSVQAVDGNGVTHAKMMEFDPLLEASRERNPRSINLTHGECPCRCLAQTMWCPEQSKLCLIFTNHQQKVTLFAVSSMLALRWIEEKVTKYRESRAPTVESIHAIDYSRRLELFKTACKVVAVPIEVRHV